MQPDARVARRLGHRLVRRPVQRLGLASRTARTRTRRSVHSSGRTTRSAPACSRTSEATRRRRESTDSSSSTAIWMSEARTLPPSWHSSRPHGPTIVTRKHCRGASRQRNLAFQAPTDSPTSRSAANADRQTQPDVRRHRRGVPFRESASHLQPYADAWTHSIEAISELVHAARGGRVEPSRRRARAGRSVTSSPMSSAWTARCSATRGRSTRCRATCTTSRTSTSGTWRCRSTSAVTTPRRR